MRPNLVVYPHMYLLSLSRGLLTRVASLASRSGAERWRQFPNKKATSVADLIVAEYAELHKTVDMDDIMPETMPVDPSKPLSSEYAVSENMPLRDGHRVWNKRSLAFLALLVGLLALAAAWRWTPLRDWLEPEHLGAVVAGVSSPGVRALVGIATVALASLAMVPLTLLAVMGGIVFGGWEAFAYVLIGAVSSSALGFLSGQCVSRDAVERLAGSRLDRLSKRLASRGIITVAVLRLVPIAPFTVFNVVAGASHLSLWQFLLGSLLGLAPGIGAITFFSSTLWGALTLPG